MLELRAPLTSSPGPGAWVMVRAEGHGSVVAALAIDDDLGRIRLGLPFLDGARVIDVSIQPGVWVENVGAAAEAHGAAPNTWKDRIRADLVDAGIGAGWWSAAEMARLDAVTVAIRAAWPLLRSTPSTEREIPRWAAPLLERPTVADGARELLGDRVTRPVVRALGARLEVELDWWPLAVATAATSVRRDHLARLLDTATSARPGRRQGEIRPSVDDVELLRTVLEGADPLRIIRLLTPPDGVEPDDHVRQLLAAADGWRRSMPQAGVLPATVEAMRQRITTLHGEGQRTVTPVRRTRRTTPRRWPSDVVHPTEHRDPGPGGAADTPHPLGRPPRLADLIGDDEAEVETPAPDDGLAEFPAWQVPRMAPGTRPNAPSVGERFDHPARARRLHRLRSGAVSLVLPDGPGQLAAWGTELRNCLPDFTEAVADERSVVLGVMVDDELVGALELDGALRINQLLGPRNQPLERWLEAAVVDLLP